MPHMEGIFINGEKAKFHPEDILDTDASQYTEEIGESVTAYLTEHITNPSNPPIDTSLSIAGAAADAKETGDKISELKEELNVSSDFYDSLLYCDFASYNTITGSSHSSNEMIISINVPSGIPIYVNIGFDQNNTAQITPKFYYSDGTSVAKASVTVNGTYTYTESKGVIGLGFYNGATLPNGKMSIGVWSAKSPTEILKSINMGNGVLAIYPESGADANTLDKNMTLYSFGSSNTPANLPTGVQVGNLINLRGNSTAGRSAQILIDSQTNQMYFRAKTGGTWSSWSGTTSNQITLKKTASDTFSIYVPNESGHVVRYDYIHRTKTWDSLTYTDGNGQAQTASNVKSCDIWNNYYIYNNDSNAYIAQGHSNFIVNINDDVDKYCGDGHGNEVAISFDILADGNLINIDTMSVNSVVKCSSIRLIHRGNVYKVGGSGSNNNYADSYPLLDTNGNPIVVLFHFMEIQYNIGNRVTIDNKIVVMQDSITFNECHGAMLECQFTDFDTVICNNEENTQNDVSDSGTFTVATGSTKNLANTSQKCNVVEMFGKDFYIRQSMSNDALSDDTTNVVYFNKYTDRLKCYFQPVKTVNRSIGGVTPDTFNVGDVIAVTDVRQIDI